MILVVTGEGSSAGTIALDVTEARDIIRLLVADAPKVEKVDTMADDAAAVVRSIAKEK